jgi:hypothetical protein
MAAEQKPLERMLGETFLFAAAAVVLLAGTADAHTTKHAPPKAASRDFDFRGAALGMSLADFEALPQLENAGAISCGPDPLAKYAAAGVMECTRPGDNPFLSISTISYDFCLGSDNTARLCIIAIMAAHENFGETNFDKALRELSSKWGAPDKVVNSTAENGLGQPVATHKIYWDGGANKITLETPCMSDLEYFCINYDNSALESVMEAKAKSLGADEASKF